MQPSFKRNIILILESFLAFFLLQLLNYFIGKDNSMLMGAFLLLFSISIFLTTYFFVRRKENKSVETLLNIQTELAN